MQQRTAAIALGLAATLAALAGCDRQGITDPATTGAATGPTVPTVQTASAKKLSLALCAPSRGGFSLANTNPFFPIDVGRQLILTGEEEGEAVVLQVTVLDRTRTIAGVTTRVVEEREFRDGELAEVTWNYHVRASDGTNCYYGEDVDIYEEGGISHEGAWCADQPGRQAGIFMPAEPKPGMKYQNEVAPGVAEDEAKIVGIGPVTVPFGRFTNTIRIREFDPLSGDKDRKVHAAGVGIIIDGVLSLTEIHQTAGVPDQPTLTLQQCGP
jgi:hypothetical protein